MAKEDVSKQFSEYVKKKRTKEEKNDNSTSGSDWRDEYMTYKIDRARKEGRLEEVMSPIIERYNTYVKNSSSYIDEYYKRYGIDPDTGKSSIEDNDGYAWRGDTSDYLDTVTSYRDNMASEAEYLSRMFEYYKPYLNEEYYNQVINSLSGYGNALSKMTDYAQKDYDYYSKFENEEAYLDAWWRSKFAQKYSHINSIEDWQNEYEPLAIRMASEAKVVKTPTGLDVVYEDENKERELEYLKGLGEYLSTKYYDEDGTISDSLKSDWDYFYREEYVDGAGADLDEIEAFDRSKLSKSELDARQKEHDEKIKQRDLLRKMEEYEAYTQSPDFETFSKYTSNYKEGDAKQTKDGWTANPTYSFHYSDNIDPLYEYINRNETVVRMKDYEDMNSWKTVFGVDNGFLKELNDHEISLYNYLYHLDKMDGGGRANEYIELLTLDLKDRRADRIFEEYLEGNTLGELLSSIPAGLSQFTSGIDGIFKDEYDPSINDLVSEKVRKDLADDGKILWYDFSSGSWEVMKVGGNSGAQALYDIGSTAGNMLPSILVSLAVEAALPTYGEGGVVFAGLTASQIGAAAGAVTTGASAMGNAKQELLSYGYSVDQATAYGLMVGASEAGLSYLLSGIPGLRGGDGVFNALGQKAINKVDNAIAKAAIALGGDMLDEGLEEGLQTVLENWFKEIATGVDWDDPSVDEILYSSLLGALTSAGFGGGKLAIDKGTNIINTSKIGSSFIKQNGQSGVGALAAQGLGMNQNTVAYKQASKVQSKIDNGKSAGRYSVGKLVSSMSESQTSTAVQTRLSAHIENKTEVRKLSNTITDILYGREVSDKALSAVADNKYALNTLNDVLGAKLKKGATVSDVKAAVKSYQTATTSKSGANASTNAKQGSEVKISGGSDATFSVQENADGGFDVIAEASGNSGSIANYETQKQAQAAAYGYTLGMGAEGVSGLVNLSANLPDGVNLGDAAQAFNAIYSQGKNGKAFSAVKFGELLSPEQRQYAYNLGIMDKALDGVRGKKEGDSPPASNMQNSSSLTQRDGNSEVETADRTKPEFLDNDKVEKAQAKVDAAKRTDGKKKKGAVIYDGDRSKLSDMQKKSLDVLDKVAEALGVTFRIYESERINGKFVYEKPDGVKTSANGWYDSKTGEIWLDINAGLNGEGTLIFTAAHELTHFIKQWSPAKFKIFADFLIEQYGERGISIDELVQRRIDKAKKKGEDIDPDTVYEEVIADSCETFLRDSDAIEKITELHQKDASLAQKIKQFLRDMLKRLRELMKGMDPDSLEGKVVAEMTESLEQLHKLWTDALADAGEAYSGAESVVNSEGEVKEQARGSNTIRDTSYNAFREIMAKLELDEVSKKLGKQFPLSADFDVTMIADKTPLQMETVVKNSVITSKGKGAFVTGKNAFTKKYGTKTDVHIKQLGLDAELYSNIATESISKAIGQSNQQSTLDVIPHLKEILNNSICLAVERVVHTDNKRTSLFGYRLYNFYWYQDGKNKTLHCLVSTVVQNTDNAEGHVFKNIENVTIGRGLPGKNADMSASVNGDTYSISQLYQFVKGLERKDGGIKYSQVEKQTYGFEYDSRNDGALYSDRDYDAPTNREILANLLESEDMSPSEKGFLTKYKNKISQIEANEAEISEMESELKELRKAGKKDSSRAITLEGKIENRRKEIARDENMILNLESTKPIKELLKREKDAAYAKGMLAGQMAQGRQDAAKLRKTEEKLAEQKRKDGETLAEYKKRVAEREAEIKQKNREKLAEQREKARENLDAQAKRYQESRKKATEGRHKTAMRHKIAGVVSELDKLLRKGTKERNVKIGLQDAVASVLELFDMNEEKVERYNKAIADLDARIAATTDPVEIEALTELRDKKIRNSERLADKLQVMKKAYEDIHNGRDGENYPSYYKAECEAIENRIAEVMEKVGETPISEMSLEQLESVYDMYRMVLTTVQNANKVFKNGKLADLTADATDMTSELQRIKKLAEERLKVGDDIRSFVWNELTPYYAFNRIGSDTLMSYYHELIRGQDVYARDIEEAQSFAEATRKKHGYGKWKLDKVHSFKDKDGRDFRLTLRHMMSIYAYSKREQAFDHMEKGGFFFNNKETFRKKAGVLEFIASNESGYKVDARIFAQIKGALTAEQIAYVDEMQAYLTKMGEKGNEVTRVMWGIDIFTEDVYFPLNSKEDFIYQANTPAETSSLKNDGMTKETKPHASNPIVLESFDDVWANHVEKMSKYHGFVIPIDNLNKLINYGTWMSGENARSADDNIALSDADLDDYIKTGKTKHTRDKKIRMLESGNSPILTRADEIKQFILDCIHGKALGQAKAFGKVGKRLSSAIMAVRSDINLNDNYLEINSDSLREAYKRHSTPKEKGDIPLSEADFQSIPELLNDFDGVTSVDSFNGKVEAHIYKRTEDGYIRLITVVSSERKSLQVTKMIGVSQNKFEEKYGKKIERDSANRRGQTELTAASNPSTTATSAESLSKDSISHPDKNVNRNFSTNSEMGSHSISTMLEARFGPGVNEYLNTFIKDLNGAKAQSGAIATFATNLVSKFKKTSVAASLSVVVQQPTAILRALSEIDAKYFVHIPKPELLNKKWKRIQKYAPIAILKDIGGFDAGAGRQITEWINADTKRGVDRVMNKIDDITMYGAALGDRIGWSTIWTAVEREVLAKQKLDYGSEAFYEAVGKRFTDVIVKTQVYDSTLSRSGFMRGKDGLMKMATAFMGEPTLSINMLADTLLQAKRGKISKGQVVRTFAAVYTATVAASIIKSFIYALRDDDEDESYAEKYMQALGGSILNDINPLSMLPILRDVVSIFQGWDVERTDMAVVQDLYNAINSLGSEKKTTYRKIEDLAGAVAALVGVPVKNVMRTAREIYNAIDDIFDGIDGGDLGDAFIEGITGKEAGKRESMYNALISGDPERIEIYRDSYDSEDKYLSAVKQVLREYDPRVQRAVEGALSGSYGVYNEMKDAVKAEKHFDVKTVNNAFADEKEYVLGKLNDARKARREGNTEEYNKIIKQLVERGYSEEFIKKKLK